MNSSQTASTTTHSAAAAATAGHDPARLMLLLGTAAAPVFIALAAAQIATRDGFDLGRHMLSLLAVGPYGFIQIANFVVVGVLLMCAGAGLRRTAPGAVTATWAPRLVAGFGAGMVVAGVFTADPAFGYPVGTPQGPGPVSWHGALHGVGFVIAMVSWTAACAALARWFRSIGDGFWCIVCLAALPSAAALAAVPYAQTGTRVAILSALQLLLVSGTCMRLLRARALAPVERFPDLGQV